MSTTGKARREELKKLQSMQAGIKAELNALELQGKDLKNEISAKKMTLNTLQQRIEKLLKQSEEVTISEHAILRYLERVVGVDIEQLADKILPPSEKALVEEFRTGRFPVNQGDFKIVVQDGVVVTVI